MGWVFVCLFVYLILCCNKICCQFLTESHPLSNCAENGSESPCPKEFSQDVLLVKMELVGIPSEQKINADKN